MGSAEKGWLVGWGVGLKVEKSSAERHRASEIEHQREIDTHTHADEQIYRPAKE